MNDKLVARCAEAFERDVDMVLAGVEHAYIAGLPKRVTIDYFEQLDRRGNRQAPHAGGCDKEAETVARRSVFPIRK
jgi:hypothetical protein